MNSTERKVACIQLNSGSDVDQNLAAVARWLTAAAAEGAELALLPENFALMSSEFRSRKQMVESGEASRVLGFLSDQARRHGMAIIGGSLPLQGEETEKVRNACPVVDETGAVLAVYDKMHLFDVDIPGEHHRESATILAGKSPVTVTWQEWKLGLSICYDLRFPALYQYYSGHGCTLLSVPAAFTVPTGRAHWEVLLRARAIENQCYVLAAGQWGEHPGERRTWGHSMIVDPWGEVLAQLEEGEGILTAWVSLEVVKRVRQCMPVLQHRLKLC